MAENRVREFNWIMVVLGIGFIVLPPWFAWALVGTKFTETKYIVTNGTESTATVKSRDTQGRQDSRGRRKESKRSELNFDSHWGTVPFWVESNTVPVVYDDTKQRPASDNYRPVLIGKKSDGYFSVLHQNHGKFVWVPFTFWTLANVLGIGFGVLMLVTGLGLRAGYQSESKN